MKKVFIYGILPLAAVIWVAGTAIAGQSDNYPAGTPFKQVWEEIDSLTSRMSGYEGWVESFFDVFMPREEHKEDVELLQIRINGLEAQVAELQATRQDCCNTPVCAPETCDGLDNDCDGEIDDGFNAGEVCTVGLGECQASGVYVCTPDGAGTECSALAGESVAEICDGLDNDCDGNIDEGFNLGTACSVGVGECQADGVYICTADGNGTECSATAGVPAEEICDELDNDCDGSVDEGLGVAEGCGPCVDLDDPGTWDSRIEYSYNSYKILDNTLLCTKTYNLEENESISIINPNLNLILNCNGATIVGYSKAPGGVSGIAARYYNCGKYGACPAYTTIMNCNVEHFNTGMTFYMSDHVTVRNNTVTDTNSGVVFLGVRDSLFEDNTISQSAYDGLSILLGLNYPLNYSRASLNNTIRNNTIDTSGAYGFHMTYSHENTIESNTVTGSNSYGLYLYECSTNMIYNNYFDNTSNVHTHSQSDFTNTWNIDKTAGTSIIGGDFLGGNYWSDYTGSDDDGDGLGDHDLPYTAGGQIDEAGGGDNLPLVY